MEKNIKFEKLTPTTEVELGVYDDALDYAFSNKDILNIGMSGSYGAGKSSVIESYEKMHKDMKFLHISLAHFEKKDGDETPEIKILEGKILNQLIHQIPTDDISKAGFRIKKDANKKELFNVSIGIMIFLVSSIFLMFGNAWCQLVDGLNFLHINKILAFTKSDEMKMLAIVSMLILGFYAVYRIVKVQTNHHLLKSINIKDYKVELFEEDNNTYFDKYLNEVLYLFEHTNSDAIVFEDMDRFDNTLIFEKLREINYLLNKRAKARIGNEYGKSIRFLYLLRDDIFVTKDRTKFFDFIVPIVPVVDGSNSADQFLIHFNQVALKKPFDVSFLNDLSLYVDDMRILKNIYNEFIVYKERFEKTSVEQTSDKLLAMIVYKNLFPRDFSLLQVGQGYVHYLFMHKETYVKTKKDKLQKQIDTYQLENAEIQKESSNCIEDIQAIYFKCDEKLRIGNKTENDYESHKAFVQALLSNENKIEYKVGSGNYYSGYTWEKYSITQHIEDMKKNEEYQSRLSNITKRTNNQEAKNQNEIAKLQKEMSKLDNEYLKNIIERDNQKIIFAVEAEGTEEVREQINEVMDNPYFPLIKYLISKGYIDENYSDYMTYFYAERLTVNDKNFLRGITDRVGKPMDYHIDDCMLVSDKIRDEDWKEEECRNFDLVEFLLTNVRKYSKQLENLVYGIWNEEPIEFVQNFILNRQKHAIFVKQLNRYWNTAGYWILTEAGFSNIVKRRYAMDTIALSEQDEMEGNNVVSELIEFISEDLGFLSEPCADKERACEKLNELEIRFLDIDMDLAQTDLLDYVYHNNSNFALE